MRVTGVKVIKLTTEEKTILTEAAHLLDDLAEHIGSVGADDGFVRQLKDCYDTCLYVVQEGGFEYAIDE